MALMPDGTSWNWKCAVVERPAFTLMFCVK